MLGTNDVASVGPVNLARLPLRWRRAPKRWGHPLHSLCSYFAMFPPQLPSVFIRWLTDPGDVVFDPFSGRGTVPLQAILHDRMGFGADANPLAVALTGAKVRIPSIREVARRIDELETSYIVPPIDAVPEDISMLYSQPTLEQLVYLREALEPRRRSDNFLRAVVLGLMHGNHSKHGATRALSLSMPNTFAMAPGYVRSYVAANKLVAPQVDAFAMLRRRVSQLALPDEPIVGGKACLLDATSRFPDALTSQRAKLVFTSPPYLEVIKYGKYNWIRLWFLGHEPSAVDARLMASSSVERYRAFLASALTQLGPALREDGFVCFVIGDVRSRRSDRTTNLAADVWKSVAEPLGWHLHGLVTDRVPASHKVSRIWATNRGRATKTDRILILSRQPQELPALAPISWSRCAFGAQEG